MALPTRPIAIPFAKGIDTKTDPRHVLPGKLLTLENGIFDQLGSIQKRNGYTKHSPGIFTASKKIGGVASIFSRGDELFLAAQQNRSSGTAVDEADGWMLYSLDGKTDKFQEIGHFIPVELSKSLIMAPGSEHYDNDFAMPNIAAANGYTAYFTASRVGLRRPYCTILEDTTGSKIVDEHLMVNLIHYNPQAIGVNDAIHAWAQGNGIVIDFWNVATASLPTMPAVDGTKIADSHADHLFDVCYSNDVVDGPCSVVAYKQNGTMQVIVKWFDEGGTLLHTVDLGVASACKNVVACQRVYDHNTDAYYIAIAYQSNATGNIECAIRKENSTIYKTAFVVTTTTAAENPHNLTVIEDPSYDSGTAANSSMRFYIEVHGAAAWQNFIRTATGKFDSTGQSDGVTFRGSCLASKAFKHDGKARVWVVNDSTTQATLFLKSAISTTKHRTDAKFLFSRADGVTEHEGLTNVINTATDEFKMAAIYRTSLSSEGEIRRGIASIKMDFSLSAFIDVEGGPTDLLATGGLLMDIDGRAAENGFHLYPETISIVGLAGVNVPDDPYYVAIYEWVDRKGQRHRSAPTPTPVTINHGAATNNTVTIQCLQQGEYDRINGAVGTFGSSVEISLYRKASDGNYHFVAKGRNDPSNDSISLADTYTDAVIEANETLYCNVGTDLNQGEVEHTGPPACRIVAAGNNRVMAVDDEDRTKIYASKKKVFGRAVEFSDLLVKRVTTGGDIMGLIEMDGKWVVFKEYQIRAFAGDGPNALGSGRGSAWTEDRQINGDVGCMNHRSVVRSPVGIIFKSHKGFKILTRGGAVKYIGADVEDHNSHGVLSAKLMEETNQVRFLLDNGTCLVFDYLVKQWSVFTNHAGIDADIYKGDFIFIKSDGTLRIQSTGYVDDEIAGPAGNAIRLKLKTSWNKLAEVQGFQRVRAVALIGEFITAHALISLVVNVFLDYDYTTIDTIRTLTESEDQMRFKPETQKCQAMAFEIYDVIPSLDVMLCGGLTLSHIQLEAGVKRPLAKMKSSKNL